MKAKEIENQVCTVEECDTIDSTFNILQSMNVAWQKHLETEYSRLI